MADPAIARCAVELRPSSELGATRSGGLSGRHHFSFAAYQRPDRLEWGALRAVHFYRLKPRASRLPSFHAGFEILTLVTGGCLRRTGTFAPIQPLRAGTVELVSAGTGANLGLEAIGHEPATYIEIWVRSNAPTRRSRQQFLPACPTGIGRPVASGSAPAPGSLRWRAAAQVHRLLLGTTERVERSIGEDACLYVAVLSGAISGNDVRAEQGDGLAVSGPGELTLRAVAASDILVIQTLSDG